jgi:hypothetical protein
MFGGGSDPYVVLSTDPHEILFLPNDEQPRTKVFDELMVLTKCLITLYRQ